MDFPSIFILHHLLQFIPKFICWVFFEFSFLKRKHLAPALLILTRRLQRKHERVKRLIFAYFGVCWISLSTNIAGKELSQNGWTLCKYWDKNEKTEIVDLVASFGQKLAGERKNENCPDWVILEPRKKCRDEGGEKRGRRIISSLISNWESTGREVLGGRRESFRMRWRDNPYNPSFSSSLSRLPSLLELFYPEPLSITLFFPSSWGWECMWHKIHVRT